MTRRSDRSPPHAACRSRHPSGASQPRDSRGERGVEQQDRSRAGCGPSCTAIARRGTMARKRRGRGGEESAMTSEGRGDTPEDERPTNAGDSGDPPPPAPADETPTTVTPPDAPTAPAPPAPGGWDQVGRNAPIVGGLGGPPPAPSGPAPDPNASGWGQVGQRPPVIGSTPPPGDPGTGGVPGWGQPGVDAGCRIRPAAGPAARHGRRPRVGVRRPLHRRPARSRRLARRRPVRCRLLGPCRPAVG